MLGYIEKPCLKKEKNMDSQSPRKMQSEKRRGSWYRFNLERRAEGDTDCSSWKHFPLLFKLQ
jgi:hypothetical protein